MDLCQLLVLQHEGPLPAGLDYNISSAFCSSTGRDDATGPGVMASAVLSRHLQRLGQQAATWHSGACLPAESAVALCRSSTPNGEKLAAT